MESSDHAQPLVSKGWGRAAFGLISCVLFFGVLIPIAALLLQVQTLSELLDPVVLNIALFTFLQALASSCLAVVFGLPLGLWVGRSWAQGTRAGKFGRILEILLVLPFGIPSVVAANAWVILLGRSGMLASFGVTSTWAYSLKAVLLAHVFFNIPWVALLVAQARASLPARQLEAALSMGAGPMARFRWIVWPQVRFALLGAWAQAQTFCAMSFVIVLILGGGPPVQTLETALYSRIRFGTLDLSGAVACGVWELLITLLPWSLVLAVESKSLAQRGFSFRPAGNEWNGFRPRRVRWVEGVLLLAIGIWVAPYFVIFSPTILRRFLDPSFLAALEKPLLFSLQLAVLTGVCTVGVAVAGVLAVSHGRRSRGVSALLSLALTLPGGVSVLALGLGFWLAYGRWFDPFSGSLGALLLLQVLLFLPVAFRMLRPLIFHFQTRLLEAASSLGATPLQAFWWVEWPRWRPILLNVLALVIAASLGEVAAVSLFYSEDRVPLALVLSRWMNQYRFEDARALSALLLFLSASTLIALLMPRSPVQKEVRLA